MEIILHLIIIILANG